jgi:hypothetical protein
MNVLGDLVSRDRRSDISALLAPAVEREYDYRRFCTATWKVSSLFRHFGVSDGSTVALADDPQPEPVLAFLGTALLGGIARFAPSPETKTDARVLVTATERVDDYALPPGGQRIAYGSPSDDLSVAYFERDVWSETPTEPPDLVESEQSVLCSDGVTHTHVDLLDAGRSVVDMWDLTANDVVAIRAPLREPGTIVAGIIAPLLSGGTILLPDGESVGDCAVAVENAPEKRVISPEAVVR